MTTAPTPGQIRQARQDNPKMRARDLAVQLKISEAEFVAAWCGTETTRIGPKIDTVFPRLEALGTVMALTRNKSAVHEKIGVYDRFISGKHASMMLGEKIDTRMFPTHWVHGFAIQAHDGKETKRSLQFFDAYGDAVHKIHLRQDSDVPAFEMLVADIAEEDQSPELSVKQDQNEPANKSVDVPVELLRERWKGMKDTHQFAMILRQLKISRIAAVSSVGNDFAWRIKNDAVKSMFELASGEALPIMCFVGNRGCIQIHSGPIRKFGEMGPWLNVMDEDFHLHLRLDHIVESWAVRKPTDKGFVTSLEAYGSDGELIIQFFGKRIEGHDERDGWRNIMEGLQRDPQPKAA